MPRRVRATIEDRDARVRAAETALDAGRFAEAEAEAARAVDAADGVPEGGARSSARRLRALALLELGRADDAEEAANEAARIARAARSARGEAAAETTLSEIVSAKGDYLGALRHASRAESLASRAREKPVAASALAEHAIVLSRLGDDESARGIFDQAVALAESAPPRSALVVHHRLALWHRAAGRWAAAFAALDRADDLLRAARAPAMAWPIATARVATLVDVGATEDARALLAELEQDRTLAGPRRAEVFALSAQAALAAGARPEVVERLAFEGLAEDAASAPTRVQLERLRAAALLARGRAEEAERIAVELVTRTARVGAHALAADAMALAARAAGRAEAALLRWLGALALGTRGVAARVEHEALAALATEPDPIGALARTALSVVRARLVAHAPEKHRATVKRALRQVEAKLLQQREARRADAEIALGDDALRAKEEVGLVGSSPALLRAVATMARAAKSEASVVIAGETGSGKELFARLAHRLSARASGPFVAINCAAIPEPLLEAELFGHERGAFTGAERARTGLFVEAQGGTLLLDEVGEMSAAMQAKLLRVLEEREVRPIGGSRARRIDVRVLAATHRELSSMVATRTFREDLFYRLAAITVRVPSLRDRREDVPVIARAILARDPTTAEKRLDVPALTALAEHAWPGNVRELANVLRVAATMSEGNIVEREELAHAISQGIARVASRGVEHAHLEETTLAALRGRQRAELRDLVGRAIASADGNKVRAARALGISRQGLYRVLAECDDG